MLRCEARQWQVSTYSAGLTWYASSSTGVRRKEGWWVAGGGICSTHSIYGCKVKRHFFLTALLSVRKNRKQSDPVGHSTNDGSGQNEHLGSTWFDTTQCRTKYKSPNYIPKYIQSSSFPSRNLLLAIISHLCHKFFFPIHTVYHCLRWKVYFRLIRWLIRL